jgi:hypothetical protein
MRESTVSILSTHVWMTLSTCYTFCPQRMYHRSLLLLGAILKFRCHVHRFIATLTLTARSLGLPCQLVTWHPTIPLPTPLRKYKNAETFWRFLVHSLQSLTLWYMYKFCNMTVFYIKCKSQRAQHTISFHNILLPSNTATILKWTGNDSADSTLSREFCPKWSSVILHAAWKLPHCTSEFSSEFSFIYFC